MLVFDGALLCVEAKELWISKSEQRLKKFMQKPLHERSYGGKCCPNHGKQYGELLEAIM
jgi:hypothetical protein